MTALLALAAYESLLPYDMVRAAAKHGVDRRTLVRVAAACARSVLHLTRPQDRDVCERAIVAAERFAGGENNTQECRAAVYAADAVTSATAATAATAASAARAAVYATSDGSTTAATAATAASAARAAVYASYADYANAADSANATASIRLVILRVIPYAVVVAAHCGVVAPPVDTIAWDEWGDDARERLVRYVDEMGARFDRACVAGLLPQSYEYQTQEAA